MRFLLFSLFFFAFASLGSVVRAAEEVNDPDVFVLTEANFDSFVNGEDLTLVEFYAPWCGHCKQLAPEYAQAATTLKDNDPPIKIAKVDATKDNALAGRFGVNGYPTLKLFRNGKDYEYKGPRKADGIVSYMKKQVGPAAKPVDNDAQLKKLLKADVNIQYVVMGFFNSDKSQLQTSFTLLSNTYRDEYLFGKSSNAELAAKYGVEGEGIVVFLFGEAKKYTGSGKKSELEEFIKEQSLPIVGVINEHNHDIYRKRNLPIAKVYMKVEVGQLGSKHLKYYTNRIQKIAEEYKGKLIVALADKASLKPEVEHLNLQNDEFGFAISDGANNKFYRYDVEEDDKLGKFDPKGYSEFIKKYMDDDVKSYVKSERPPSKNNGPVKVVTGQTFDDIVLDDDKDVMIEFYAPWCGHCKALEPKYKELGEKLKKHENVVIAKMDATANDWDRSAYEVKGYPTIFFKPAGKKAVIYEGAREVKDMLDYIKKKGKTIKQSKKSKKDEEAEEPSKKSKKKQKKSKKKVVDDEDDE